MFISFTNELTISFSLLQCYSTFSFEKVFFCFFAAKKSKCQNCNALRDTFYIFINTFIAEIISILSITLLYIKINRDLILIDFIPGIDLHFVVHYTFQLLLIKINHDCINV